MQYQDLFAGVDHDVMITYLPKKKEELLEDVRYHMRFAYDALKFGQNQTVIESHRTYACAFAQALIESCQITRNDLKAIVADLRTQYTT